MVILIHPSDSSLLNPFTKKVLLDFFIFSGYILYMSVCGDKHIDLNESLSHSQDWNANKIESQIEQLNNEMSQLIWFIHKQDASVDSDFKSHLVKGKTLVNEYNLFT